MATAKPAALLRACLVRSVVAGAVEVADAMVVRAVLGAASTYKWLLDRRSLFAKVLRTTQSALALGCRPALPYTYCVTAKPTC